MVFRERLHHGPIRNNQGPNPGEYPYLRGLHYHNTQIKGVKARVKGPRNLKTY